MGTRHQLIDAALGMLDRQLLDKDGRPAGKVDDLELEEQGDGSPPVVVAILSGPGALARRLGGRLGGWVESVHRRLADDPEPARVPFGVVNRVTTVVELTVSIDDLAVNRFEEWVGEHVIAKIPGAGHEAE